MNDDIIKINDLEVPTHKLHYDKIIKNTLAQSDELTVRFINGLFNDDIPLDAPVVWLDKESVNDKHVAFIADSYPRVAGKMYSIEIEQDDNGDMALRVFKYTIGGAILHNMTSTDWGVDITLPQPYVIFLKSSANTPQSLTWNINAFDGQKMTLTVPAMRLPELSIDEIAERDLFPVGQFYMRTFEPLTKKNIDRFKKTAEELSHALKKAVERKSVPYHIGSQMQDIIRKTIENTIAKANEEVELDMHTSITETLDWIDYPELYRKLEERGKAEGKAEGISEIARNLLGLNLPLDQIVAATGLSLKEVESLRQ